MRCPTRGAPQSVRATRRITSLVVVVSSYTRATPWRQIPGRLQARLRPSPRIRYEGEDCLSEASSAAQAIGTGAKAPEGPRLGAHGFGSFCRNKRTSSCGAETPQNPPSLCHPRPDRGSSVVVFVFCRCSRAIPGQSRDMPPAAIFQEMVMPSETLVLNEVSLAMELSVVFPGP